MVAPVRCALCGREHDALDMGVAFQHPDAFLSVPEREREARCWAANSTDLRQVDGASFIRCTLNIRVFGREHPFMWGIWAEVPEERLRFYWERFDRDLATEPPFAGRIANEIPMYRETALGVPVLVRLGGETARPTLEVRAAHELLVQQREGVSDQWVFDVLHRYGII